MTATRKNAWIALLVLAALVIAYLISYRIDDDVVKAQAESLKDVLVNLDTSRSAARKQSNSAKGAHLFPGVPKSRKGLPLEGDPFLAESAAEQAWLDRNGYPNKEQWLAYSRASDALLKEAADGGDSVAGVVLNSRRLAMGEPGSKEDLLINAVDGSGYALELYSAYMAGSKSGSAQTAYALSRVAEMRGNYRVAMAREGLFNTPLTQAERMTGDAEAMVLFARLKELNEQFYGTSSNWIDPRPYGKQKQ
jgi:hypothetical protein